MKLLWQFSISFLSKFENLIVWDSGRLRAEEILTNKVQHGFQIRKAFQGLVEIGTIWLRPSFLLQKTAGGMCSIQFIGWQSCCMLVPILIVIKILGKCLYFMSRFCRIPIVLFHVQSYSMFIHTLLKSHCHLWNLLKNRLGWRPVTYNQEGSDTDAEFMSHY